MIEDPKNFEMLRMCHVARPLNFLEHLRARSVEHTCSADKLISVVVIAVRLRVMTQVVFRTAGVCQNFFRLFRACFHIGFHVWIRICYVNDLVRLGKIFWGTVVCSSWSVPHFLR